MSQKPTKEKQRQMRAEKQHRGGGERETYVPYIQVARGEFASRGRSHLFPSPFFRRHHHLLSDLELHVLWGLNLMAPWDVREQFPLLWKGSDDSFHSRAPYALGTVEIAENLGIKHPSFSKAEPKRMTTDFVVHSSNGHWGAVHVKHERDLDEKRNTELRTIEEAYWAERGIPLQVVTEQDMDKGVIANISMALTYDQKLLRPVSDQWLEDLIDLAKLYPMNRVTNELRRRHGGDASVHTSLIKYAVATGVVALDLSHGQLIWSEKWPEINVRRKQG